MLLSSFRTFDTGTDSLEIAGLHNDHFSNKITRQMNITDTIQMVDLKKQYDHIQEEIDRAVLEVIRSTRYIKGPVVQAFEEDLASYLGVKHVIGCANGTDALQIAVMALELKPGDEIIVPAFTYVATAEIIGLLRLTPVMVDVDPNNFNITLDAISQAISTKTKAIVPVHLFGQSAPMQEIMDLANQHNLYVIEDNAQAIGATYTFGNGATAKTGTIGHIGTTSFFPSKNLGCYGDGGAIFTNDDKLAAKMRQVANHGQGNQYYHDVLGVNSRLDAIQAAILRVKLPHLDRYCQARQVAANYYDTGLANIAEIKTPTRYVSSTHVFHQYTMCLPAAHRDALRMHLRELGIPSMIYYPVPLYKQKAYAPYWNQPDQTLFVTEKLCQSVLSLPIHSELDTQIQDHIIGAIKSYFNHG